MPFPASIKSIRGEPFGTLRRALSSHRPESFGVTQDRPVERQRFNFWLTKEIDSFPTGYLSADFTEMYLFDVGRPYSRGYDKSWFSMKVILIEILTVIPVVWMKSRQY